MCTLRVRAFKGRAGVGGGGLIAVSFKLVNFMAQCGPSCNMLEHQCSRMLLSKHSAQLPPPSTLPPLLPLSQINTELTISLKEMLSKKSCRHAGSVLLGWRPGLRRKREFWPPVPAASLVALGQSLPLCRPQCVHKQLKVCLCLCQGLSVCTVASNPSPRHCPPLAPRQRSDGPEPLS